ncbi:hypothetical protein R1sor_024917 [Riccia sorocarpa]|uniref:MLO-like protein n=1 Tax=Riccia sorocarpa TaxID=122646 RepID=A0ABD3GTR0_9MARC
MAEGDPSTRSLEFSPTWTVAIVIAVFILISLGIVKVIESVEKRLRNGKKKSLVHALEKMKEELMLLGFMSLLLTVSQSYVASVCVPSKTLENFSPCHLKDRVKAASTGETPGSKKVDTSQRRLLEYLGNSLLEKAGEVSIRRQLAEGEATACGKGKEPLMSVTGLHQLHIFIFVLAVVHVVFSVVAMGLAMLKVRSWKNWEEEAQANSHDEMQEMSRRLTIKRQSTFVAYHSSKKWSHNRLMVWVVCFFRQFGISVTRADYVSLRLGFIKNHNTGSDFNFYSYMIRCMEDEFQQIVGISAWLWLFVVAFLLFNVNGSNLYFWMCFLPVGIVLVVGTKLQHIIATLAIENAMTRNPAAAIKPRDELFWFSTPTLLLKLIHFVLFQNAFELATFLWYMWQFGFGSCLLENKAYVYIRIGLGILTQILVSYSTLPLYALVTQMGSHYKHSIFQNDVKEKLHNWRKGAKRRAKLGASGEDSSYPGDDDSHDRSVEGTEDESTISPERPFNSRSGAEIARDEKMMRQLGSATERPPNEVSTNQVPQSIEMAPMAPSPRQHATPYQPSV